MTSGWRVLGLIIATGVCVVSLPMLAPAGGDDDTKPNGRRAGTLLNPGNGNGGEAKGARPSSGGTSNGINYHGGPVMLGTVNVYYIWYGNWSSEAKAVLTDFAQNIGGSPYYNINTTYYDGSNSHLTNAVHYVTSIADNYSHGYTLSDSDVQSIVLQSISQFGLDGNGVYFVLTSSDVTESSGFCKVYCGWHTHTTSGIVQVKYAFVGDPTQCPTACEAQAIGPNGSTGADGMASIIAHELEEAATDPQLNAWYDRRGYENADKCAWTFGSTYTAGNGASANVKLGARDYLIQRNWVNANGGYCALSFP